MLATPYYQLLLETAKQAGDAIMEFYRKGNIEVGYKADKSVITEADKAAHNIILANLKETPFPIVSEEDAVLDSSKLKNVDTFWLIDPLDGTKEFVNRTDEFTVNIALIHKQKSIFGVIYVPATDTFYTGGENTPSVKIKGGKEKLISCVAAENNTIRLASSRSFPDPDTGAFIKKLQENFTIEEVIIGSSLKFCSLAEGSLDLYPRLTGLMEWDVAAGHAIVKGAGGNVFNFETQQEITYVNNNFRLPGFVAKKNIE
jgi:3'(2'), 5'-bisphosphate nucleotidase